MRGLRRRMRRAGEDAGKGRESLLWKKSMVFRHFHGGLLDLGRHGVEGVRPGGRQVVLQAGFVQLGHVRLQNFFRRQAGKQPDEDRKPSDGNGIVHSPIH